MRNVYLSVVHAVVVRDAIANCLLAGVQLETPATALRLSNELTTRQPVLAAPPAWEQSHPPTRW